MDNNNNSGVNTVLIVIVLIIIVGAAVWFLRGGFTAPQQEDSDFNIDVNLPEESGGEGSN